MKLRVLGSGSGGNCTLLETENFKLLIDAARLSQKYIRDNLESTGCNIRDIGAILATHMHGDHVDPKVTLPLCRKNNIPLYVHSGSVDDLYSKDSRFRDLEYAGLLRTFGDDAFMLRDNLSIRPFHVRHGGSGWCPDLAGRPVGFRITHIENGSEKIVTYTTDLGMPEPHVEEALADSDAIVIESNHDIDMERNSKRPAALVKWVMGPTGHLSNDEAAELVAAAALRSGGRLSHVFLAHLSRDCNSPEIAFECMRSTLEKAGVTGVSIHLTAQRMPSDIIVI